MVDLPVPDEPVARELEALLCFDLYAAQRAVTAAYRPILGELGLTYPQYLVLVVLWARGSCGIKDLATTLRLDHATLTPLLRRMEAAGLVGRSRDPRDARGVVLRLAAAGEALRPQAEVVQCRIADALGLAPDEVVALQGLLRAVTGHLAEPKTGVGRPTRGSDPALPPSLAP